MKFLTPCLIACCSLVCCKSTPAHPYVAPPTTTAKDSVPAYQYKELAEDPAIDEMKKSEIKDLFGEWTITAIAKATYSVDNEKAIFSNIGKKIHFDSSIFIGNTMGVAQKVLHPHYSIERIKVNDDAADLRATTYFEGYKLCRKAVIILHVDSVDGFEVINDTEMAEYSDAIFYFYTKKE